MANPLEQAAVRRKAIYVGVILGLFTVSLFWRGKLGIPLADARAEEGKPPPRVAVINHVRRGSTPASELPAARSPVHAVADWLQARAIETQADRDALDLQELQQGDPEIAGAAARLSLVGMRGFVITSLWRAAIEKQKRNEWHDLELLVRTVTRLQPNFITPWIYQSWNIAYNVSVENDRLNDMFFYIARGIDLLAEGERLNRNSPDMRYQIGFYYANKFGVSDKVVTLRSLMQLAAMKPGERNPRNFETAEKTIRPDEFQRFVRKNPQLVRRLREKLGYTRPEQIVRFLDDNAKVPTRYDRDRQDRLLPDREQFPALPPTQTGDEAYTRSETDDTFDAFLAARAWYEYSLAVVPPATPEPSATPKLEGEDRFRYRIPKQPMLIIFRQQAPRAQSYYAERLMKEGWFDRTTAWNPDERADTDDQLWFPREAPERLQTNVNAQAEWARAYNRWKRHGTENGLDLSQSQLTQYAQQSAGVPGSFNVSWLDLSDDELASYGVTRDQVVARAKLTFYDQNRGVTNFPYFLENSNAEQADVTVAARKTLWDADRAREAGDKRRAIDLYARGLNQWRQVLLTFPRYHREQRTQTAEEILAENLTQLTLLLEGDPGLDRRAEQVAVAVRALVPGATEAELRADLSRELAAAEAGYRVVREDPKFKARYEQILRDNHLQPHSQEKEWPELGLGDDGFKRAIFRREFAWAADFADPVVKDDTTRWVSTQTLDQVRERLGLKRRQPATPPPTPEATADAAPNR
jgi:hypothetical protein